jgi:hypothetical protein
LEDDFGKASVDLGDFLGVGPPRDGIRTIDQPKYELIAKAAAWLERPVAGHLPPDRPGHEVSPEFRTTPRDA